MTDFLQRLRRKSPEARKRIALGSSAAITGLVFVMWVTVLNHGVTGLNNTPEPSLNENRSQTASPLSAFGDNAGAALETLRERLNGESATTSRQPAEEPEGNQPAAGYWGSNQSAPETTQQSRNRRSTETESPTSFTSRDYNPNQSSDWFSD